MTQNIWCSTRELKNWRIYIDDLEEAGDHVERIDLIRTAGPDDEIEIFISCFGGRVSLADRYAAAMKASLANITTVAVGGVMSAALTVWLNGDKLVVDDTAHFMVHNTKYTAEGDHVNIKRMTDFYDQLYKEEYFKLYSKILTPQEIEEVLNNANEIYLSANTVRERLGQRVSFPLLFEGSDWANQRVTGPQGQPGPQGPVVFPFPKTEVPKAEDVCATSFTVNFDSGERRVFNLSTLSYGDFCGLTNEQLVELGHEFDMILLNNRPWDALVKALIERMQKGV